ncbi:MAG: M1 family aminopeptidase [Candidatus Aminicenantaceae bacterium]
MNSWKKLWPLVAVIVPLICWSSKAFSQHDYVSGMEKFPDIDIIHYDLRAEFRSDTESVHAKAIVVFEMRESGSDFVIFEIDRSVKISKVKDKQGNTLKFEQPEDSDCVEVRFSKPIRNKEVLKIELDYVCNFPLLQGVHTKQEIDSGLRKGNYFFLRKWYPINDYFCDQASAEFTFTAPKNYEVLTSGEEISAEFRDDEKISRWRSFGSSNVYFVFAGPFIRYAYEDQVPRIFIYLDTEDRAVANNAREKAVDILQYYEELLCPYPYPVVHLVTSHKRIPVGMNGLTHIDYAQFSQKYRYSEWIWSHELAHHWFGGIVSSKTPEDYCLLMEASAEYLSKLYIQSIKGEKQFRTDLEVQRLSALRGYEIAPITKYYTMRRGGDFLYAKGFYIFHMLRDIMGEEKFFSMLKKLVRNFYMKEAGIQDLQKLAEGFYGISLGWFFNQWVYGTGIPEYELAYQINSKGNGTYKISGSIKQKSVKFRMPVEVVAASADSKNAIRAIVENQENPFQFEVSFEPDTVLLDPEFKALRWDESIRIWLYTSNARKLKRKKKYNQAVELLDRALTINPRCSWAAFERADVAFDLGRYELAVQYCKRALKGDLDFHMIPWPEEQMRQAIYLLQGLSQDLLGQRQEAVGSYRKVIAMGRDPRFALYYDYAKKYIEKPFSIKQQ